MPTRSVLLLLLLLLPAAAPLPSQFRDLKTAEGWIWQQVQAGKSADLNDRCNSETVDIRKRDDEKWRALCRRVAPNLLRALLTRPDLADHAPHGVLIRGAHIDGTLDLADAHIRPTVVMLDASWISGDAVLTDARLDGSLSLRDTLIEGKFIGIRTSIDRSLFMNRTGFGGPVVLRDARVDGQMDMEGASIADQRAFEAQRLHVGSGGLYLRNVKFGGRVVLRDAHVDGEMDMEGASIADQQAFEAQILHVGSGGLYLRNVKFGGPVVLRDARVDGQMDMEGASIADQRAFDAQRLHVGSAGLYVRNVKFGGPVVLRGADIDGQMDMEGASVADQQAFDAEILHVGRGGLLMRNVKFGGPVELTLAHIDSQMDMEGTSIADQQVFEAQILHVGSGGLIMRKVKFGGPVVLRDADIDGQMDMEGASIADQQAFDAQILHVGSGGLLMRNVKFGGSATLRLLTVDGAMDLRDSHARRLDLGEAVVRDDLVVGGRIYNGPEQWLRWDACDGPAPCLNLRNAKVGNLQDDERAWPDHITLEGFTYTHLGGIGSAQRQDVRNRPIGWWRDWLSRDPVYSSQPYAQLAGVLAAAGNRDGSADIRFFGRDRERSEFLRGCTWLQKLGWLERPDDSPCGLHEWGAWFGMSALQMFVGYGIGDYSFRAAGWALVLALIGTVILFFAPGVRRVSPHDPRQKSSLWCFGASLQKVLPLITISQEFTDFFNDPRRDRLHAWQHAAFGVLAVCGWALAGFVAAAFSGLIQN
jgi:hypothetical protein